MGLGEDAKAPGRPGRQGEAQLKPASHFNIPLTLAGRPPRLGSERAFLRVAKVVVVVVGLFSTALEQHHGPNIVGTQGESEGADICQTSSLRAFVALIN